MTEPFLTSRTASRKRLGTAFKVVESAPGKWAAETMKGTRFVEAIRALAALHPSGPVFAVTGIGRDRWDAYAADHAMIHALSARTAIHRSGLDTRSLVMEALGSDGAFRNGRLTYVMTRAEALGLLAVMLRDGFDFGPRWTTRLDAFLADKPYSVNQNSIITWARRFVHGELPELIAEARASMVDEHKAPM